MRVEWRVVVCNGSSAEGGTLDDRRSVQLEGDGPTHRRYRRCRPSSGWVGVSRLARLRRELDGHGALRRDLRRNWRRNDSDVREATTLDAGLITPARAGAFSRCLSPRAHADDPPSTPDEMPAVVREARVSTWQRQGQFELTQRLAIQCSTSLKASRLTRRCRLGIAVYHSAGGFEATPHSARHRAVKATHSYRRTRPRRSPRANPLHLPRTRCDKACRRRRPSSPPRMHRRA